MDVVVEEVVKTYGALRALDGVSLVVGGDVRTLVLIGPSGGGKSTLLRVLGGLDVADSGVVRIGGVEVGGDGLLAHRRRNGFLFQAFNLFPHLTAVENIVLPLVKVHGRREDVARERAMACLERFGLTGHAGKRPGEMSGGQQQRVGIARAIAHEPELLILDEPTSALDPEMTAEVLDVIRELAEAGQAIVLSTHEMGFARAVGDRVVFLADGKVVEEGTGEVVFGATRSDEARRFLARVMKY